ncbi:hypothetical protein AAFF_G00247800 [Aldrovandia affinis]|uniref:Signal-induced proliferation-associated 1-like protein 1 n=1 Tax=Aldrovandia affinis TaxID=143900 RepID=A0AAD7W443_9TELE|nr:hypothetical protein AAFF_G00247800 [Aldrovandia affinis]
MSSPFPQLEIAERGGRPLPGRPVVRAPIPQDVTFPKSTVFRDFLLAKVINGENAAHKSEKFRAMATRTRQEYLRDLAERHVTSTPIDPSGKFPFISLAHKRREKGRPYGGAELRSAGAVAWPVHAEDHGAGGELEALLAVSAELLVLVDRDAKAVVFNCAVRDVIGWTLGSPASMKIFYDRGECVSLRSINNNTEDFREVVRRLELLTKGCETSEMTLRRNGLGQLGFHINYEGIVAEVEPYGYAWQAGLRQGSRLVEICKVAVATLTHEQMIDLLRTSVSVKVVIIPPHEDATPRRGCWELKSMPASDYKSGSEGVPYEYKFPFRNQNNKWQRTSSSPQQSLSASPQGHGGTPNRAVSLGGSMGKTLSAERPAIPRSVSSDGRPLEPKRMSPGSENYALASSILIGRAPHNRSSPSSLSCSSDTGSAHWRQKSMPEGFGGSRHSPLSGDRPGIGDTVGKSTPGWPKTEDGGGARGGADRGSADAPVSRSGPSYSGGARIQRQEQVIHLSPKKSGQVRHAPLSQAADWPNQAWKVTTPSVLIHSTEEQMSDSPYSAHSSSNTLSSSSSAHSDDKWYELGGVAGGGAGAGAGGEPPDSEINGFGGGILQGASADSGIDAASVASAPGGRRGTPRPKSAHPLMRDSSNYSIGDAAHSRLFRLLHLYDSTHLYSNPALLTSGEEGENKVSSNAEQCSSEPRHPSPVLRGAGATSKYLIGWRKPGSTINSVDFGDTRSRRHQGDGPDGGHHQHRGPERDGHSPQLKGNKPPAEEKLRKLVTLDTPSSVSRMVSQNSSSGHSSGRRSLHRTLSDESIYGGQRLPSLSDSVLEEVLCGDVLFGCSTVPRSPTTRGVPLRRPSYKLGVTCRPRTPPLRTYTIAAGNPEGPQPHALPDPETDNRLDWTHLVDVANKAFEVRSSSFFSTRDLNQRRGSAASSPQHADLQATSPSRPPHGEPPGGLAGKVTQLEALVKMLQEDLKKEREEKAKLQAQVHSLWEDNQRLQEEAQSATAKLKKFTEWVFNTIDMN